MLEKQKGNHNINKLRRLNIFEADYNATLKYFWPHNANKNDGNNINMGDLQYGGRKGRRANDPAIINEFILDFHRMSHTPITIVQQDLTACFDRTVQNISNICNRRMAVPKQVCNLIAQTKEQTKYHITTAQGTSKKSYKSSKTNPIHGSAQGSGNAGTEWNNISIPILKTYDDNVEGCQIIGPTKQKWRKSIMSFVDDTRHYNNMNNIMASLAENIAHDSNIWKHLLSFTGGAQNLNKCVAYIIEWYYSKQYTLQMINDNDTTIPTISDDQNITRYNNDTPFKYLGINTSPNGDQIHPITTIQKICATFANSLFKASINERDAEIALRYKLIPKIQYQIIAYSINAKQYHKIQQIYESDTIAKMGYNRHWPYELRYDTLHSGLALPQLHLEQLIQHTIAIYNLYNNVETNILLINSLQLFQLQIGLSGNIYKQPRITEYGNSVWIRQ